MYSVFCSVHVTVVLFRRWHVRSAMCALDMHMYRMFIYSKIQANDLQNNLIYHCIALVQYQYRFGIVWHCTQTSGLVDSEIASRPVSLCPPVAGLVDAIMLGRK